MDTKEKVHILTRMRDDSKMLSTMEGSDKKRFEKQTEVLEECIEMIQKSEKPKCMNEGRVF